MKNLHQIIEELKENSTKEDFITSIFSQYHSKLFHYVDYLKETNIKNINISDEGVIFSLRDVDLEIICNDKDERSVPIETLNYSYYEYQDSEMISKIFKSKMSFYDIGANLGLYSLRLAKLNKDSKSLAFEPIKSTFSLLKNNVSRNNLSNIQTYNFGFSNKEETKVFYFYPEGTGNASSKNLSKRDDVMEIECQLTTLDLFTKNNRIKPDFIKCDVEGAELHVFQGGYNSLKEFRPIVFSEILRKWSSKFDYDPNEIFDLFYSIGYLAFFPSNGRLKQFKYMEEDTVETNFFFLHEKNHKEIIKELAGK